MITTFDIRFFGQPLPGDSFGFTLKENGIPFEYPGGLDSTYMYYANGDNAPHGIKVQASLAQTVNHTRLKLQTFCNHPSVTYTVTQAGTITVSVVHTGTLSIDGISATPGRISVITAGTVSMLGVFDADRLRMAYNNDVIRFRSTSLSATLYCDISMGDAQVRLYPDPDGAFYFNFRPYVSALINTRNFEDTAETALDASDPNSFVYDHTNGTLLSLEVTIAISLEDGGMTQSSYLLKWLAGAEQLDDVILYSKLDKLVLSPAQKANRYRWYLKYWQGYPFDIAFYLPSKQVRIKNQANGLAQDFNFNSEANRLFLSDGRTDANIEDVLPLVDGHNELRTVLDGHELDTDIRISLEKIPSACGVYFKWLNRYGGYSYWLFEKTYSVDRSSRPMGELDRDNENLEDTFARTRQIGRESRDTVRVIAELLTEDEVRILEGILDSPKIYMFTGTPFSRNSYNDWVEVILKTGNARIRNPKQPQTNFTLDLELPERYTQTL